MCVTLRDELFWTCVTLEILTRLNIFKYIATLHWPNGLDGVNKVCYDKIGSNGLEMSQLGTQ